MQIVANGGGVGGNEGANYGLFLEDLDSTITSQGGNIVIEAVGGVSVLGGSDGVNNSGKITATGSGTLTITGTAGTGDEDNSVGVYTGNLIATENGVLTITGTGTGNGYSFGVYNSSDIESTGADIVITATGAPSNGAGSLALINLGMIATANGNTNITINADSIEQGGTINAGTGEVNLRTRSANVGIMLGGPDTTNPSADEGLRLGIDNTELDGITAYRLTIDNTVAGGSEGNLLSSGDVGLEHVNHLVLRTVDDFILSNQIQMELAGSITVQSRDDVRLMENSEIYSLGPAVDIILNSNSDGIDDGRISLGFSACHYPRNWVI